VGAPLATGAETLTIVGVMPASFRFPTSREEIWRPLDLDAWPNNSGLRNVARLAGGTSMDDAVRGVEGRREAVAALVERRFGNEYMRLRSMADVRGNPRAASLFALLLGAAACLLLIACANVASLELAAAARRTRAHAVQTALGASRASLARIALLEGAALLGAGGALAVALAGWGIGVLDAQLTVPMRTALTNPLDVDGRVLAFLLAVAALTWLLTATPAIARLARFSVVDGLRDDPRTMPVSRAAARTRRWLVAGQVALTTLLLTGSLLFVRSYLAETGAEKGFDASNIATVEVFPASDAPRRGADLESAILDRLRATPWIRATSRTDSLPPNTQSGISARLTVDDRPPTTERVMLHFADVDPEYFETMQVHVIEGRSFDRSTPQDQVLIDERFARRYWPAGSPIGSRFRMQGAGVGGVNLFQVAGVVRELRADRTATAEGDEVYRAYIRISPTYHPLAFVARLDGEHRIADLTAMVRSVAERSVVRVDTIDARYARLHADTRLAAAVTSGFGVVALLVATTGIYAVMAFLVAGRSRELAIRLALGADGRGVRALVLRSALGAVAAGGLVGLVAAALASRWIRAEFGGAVAADPMSYTSVAALLAVVALAATWWPARRAARLDPAVTLRNE
jgi:predicted permease